jgi:hypothetical protein
MALEASHIRFALDIKNYLGIKEMQKYISGVIYPDSRYITRIDRNLTHPQSLLDNDWTLLDDFKKGMYAHLVYDKVLQNYTDATLTDYLTNLGEFKGQGSEYWIRLTALKILQDIEDIKAFDIKTYLPLMDYVENLNGEDINLLQNYNRFFQKLFEIPQRYSIEMCYELWDYFGIKGEIANTLRKRTEEYQRDSRIKEFISSVYSQTLTNWNTLM